MRGGLVAAQAATDLDPAGAIDHPVEHDEIGGLLGGEQQRLVAIAGGADVITLGAKAKLQQLGERRIVFHQQ